MNTRFQVGGHLGLPQNWGAPVCLRWLLKTSWSYQSPCTIAKTCHQVHNSYGFPLGYRVDHFLTNFEIQGTWYFMGWEMPQGHAMPIYSQKYWNLKGADEPCRSSIFYHSVQAPKVTFRNCSFHFNDINVISWSYSIFGMLIYDMVSNLVWGIFFTI